MRRLLLRIQEATAQRGIGRSPIARARHTCTGRPLDHRHHDAEPGMIIDPGHDLRLPHHPSGDVDKPHPADDVDLPQLHRTRRFPPHEGLPRGGELFTMLKFRTMAIDAEARKEELVVALVSSSGVRARRLGR
jgi:hypothetical protein